MSSNLFKHKTSRDDRVNRTLPLHNNSFLHANEPQDDRSVDRFFRQKTQVAQPDLDNVTFVHSDQDDLNRQEARSLWGKMPTQIKSKPKSNFLYKIPGIGRQALNESDLINYSESWTSRFHQGLAIIANCLILMSA